MWLIVGLGNPGRRYIKTRHNIGFLVIDKLADRFSVNLKESELFEIGEGDIAGERVILLKPLTYMNKSGIAVSAVSRRNGVMSENIVVIHDDLDLETGRIRIRKKGSAGGHNGVKSVIQSTGTIEFIRVKIGIDRDMTMRTEDYVLKKFSSEEVPLIREAVSLASLAVPEIIAKGVETAMNSFN